MLFVKCSMGRGANLYVKSKPEVENTFVGDVIKFRLNIKTLSHETKKGQNDCQKQSTRRTTVCLLHE